MYVREREELAFLSLSLSLVASRLLRGQRVATRATLRQREREDRFAPLRLVRLIIQAVNLAD